MKKINVNYPNVIIRVSESIPEIINYIQIILDKNFAYNTPDGSIYFDTNKYIELGYVLENNIDDDELQSDISLNLLQFKKNKRDFALWKGRDINSEGFNAEFMINNIKHDLFGVPGWHIECSTLINQTLGSDIRIHFGGIDLKFPHHHNERVQANAYYHPEFQPNDIIVQKVWSPTFMHIGHLCIKGLKMSKSLKNFTTVNEILKTINPNQLRLLFFMHNWQNSLNFDDDTLLHTKIFNETICNFFNRTLHYPYIRDGIKYNHKETELENYFNDISNKILSLLCNFKFDLASKLIGELINKTNTYLNIDVPNEYLSKKIANWILYIFNTLGFQYGNQVINFDKNNLMNVLINTRSEFRKLTRDNTIPKEIKQKIFKILDAERNIELKNIGINLQDTKYSSSWFENE